MAKAKLKTGYKLILDYPIKDLELNEGQIEEVPTNPRFIRDERFEALVQSLKDNPEMLELREVIAYDNPGTKPVVIMGNQRLRGQRELGHKFVPVKLLPPETPARTLRAYVNKDNVGFGDWDWDLIANDWDPEELMIDGVEFPFDLFADDETKEDDYEVPPDDEIETDIMPGDLIEIGSHRLICGDCLDTDLIEKLMAGKKADMVVTDPPYNIDYGNIKHPKLKVRDIENDNMSAVDFKEFCTAFSSVLKLYVDGVIYCFGPPGPDGRIMFSTLDEAFHCSTVIIWNKDQFTLGRGKYKNKYEPIWFGWNKTGKSFTDDRTLTNVWEFAKPRVSELHPTMKPLGLLEIPMKHNPQAKSVLDIFLGSGSTMAASHQLGRQCYGVELEPKYCHVTIDRMLTLDPKLEVKINGENRTKDYV